MFIVQVTRDTELFALVELCNQKMVLKWHSLVTLGKLHAHYSGLVEDTALQVDSSTQKMVLKWPSISDNGKTAYSLVRSLRDSSPRQ